MKNYFKLAILSIFIIFVTLPKIVFADQIIDFSSTHLKRIITLNNNKTLVIYVPKNKSYKNILVHFHGFGDNSLNSPSVTAIETAIKEHNYSNSVVFFPVDGICRNVENTTVINNTVKLVYNKYNEFLIDNNIKSYNLSVSQVSGTSDAANTFINLLGSQKINLFLFDSYLPNYYYSNEALKKVNNLIMLSELPGSDYLGSAKEIGQRYKGINKNGPLMHFVDSIQDHGSADNKGLNYLYPDFVKNGKLGDNYSRAQLKLQENSTTNVQTKPNENNNSTNNNNNNTNNNSTTTNSTKNYGLTKEEVEKELNNMKSTPTYDELLKLAKDKYGMSEDVFQVAFGWGIGEGYDSAKDDSGNVDHYLGYLCDCIGVNFYMGYKLKSADELAAKLRGGNHRYYYFTNVMQKRAQDARDNPKSYEANYKGMYLALKYPDENAHACYGPSESERQFYFSQGGEVYYSGGIYKGFRIEVWEQWYRTGFEHWNSDGEYSSNSGILGGGLDTGTVILDQRDPRINYADLCKSEGFRTGSKIAGTIILIAKWLAPMILIILGMTDFIKAITSNENDSLGKATKIFIIRMVIAILIPFIPGLLYYLADYFIGDLKDETGDLVSCTECLKKPFSCEVELYDYNNQR